MTRLFVASLSRAFFPLVTTAALTQACGGRVYIDPPALGPDELVVPMSALSPASYEAIDLLVLVDNSRSMADKQDVLALSIDSLVRGLASPPCVDAAGAVVSEPADPLAACPDGSARKFTPLGDMHIGVVTSSLGGLQNACDQDMESPVNDRGHLVVRTLAPPFQAPTWQELGFLAWDPQQKLVPAGEADLDSDGADPGSFALLPVFRDMVRGAGQLGCGYEATLESAYRFLVDPAPYADVTVEGTSAVQSGVDQVVLDQRASFLRPGSLLAVVLLSDENDCSFRLESQYWVGGWTNDNFHLPPPRSECAANPNDPCCLSCAQPQGSCPPDPACAVGALDPIVDHVNLRCFDQKRRFGVDFLHPISRYAEGFGAATISLPDGSLAPNPLFAGRPAAGALFLGIVGVPWQDIAHDPLDLKAGLLPPSLLGQPGPNGQTPWDLILGDPAAGVLPGDPLMQESVEPRGGVNPPTGEALAPPSDFHGNPINGNEFDIPGRDDLQYACIFPLPVPKDCSDPVNNTGCDCPLQSSPDDDTGKPVCNPDPALDHMQTHAKAYPGRRVLSVLRALGPQGLVGSICSEQLSDAGAADYGYRPSVNLLLGEAGARVEGRCLTDALPTLADGTASCVVMKASDAAGCSCDGAGTKAASEAQVEQATAALGGASACVCVVTQLAGEALAACQSQADPGADGWCYVDATQSPPIGDPSLVASCPDARKRTVRLVGGAAFDATAQYLIGCQ